MYQKPPTSAEVAASMDDIVENDIDPAMMPNRSLRRKYEKLHRKGKKVKKPPTFSHTEDERMEILKHIDTQALLSTINGLLTGQKKLVISSKQQPTGDFRHTFLVEDVVEVEDVKPTE